MATHDVTFIGFDAPSSNDGATWTTFRRVNSTFFPEDMWGAAISNVAIIGGSCKKRDGGDDFINLEFRLYGKEDGGLSYSLNRVSGGAPNQGGYGYNVALPNTGTVDPSTGNLPWNGAVTGAVMPQFNGEVILGMRQRYSNNMGGDNDRAEATNVIVRITYTPNATIWTGNGTPAAGPASASGTGFSIAADSFGSGALQAEAATITPGLSLLKRVSSGAVQAQPSQEAWRDYAKDYHINAPPLYWASTSAARPISKNLNTSDTAVLDTVPRHWYYQHSNGGGWGHNEFNYGLLGFSRSPLPAAVESSIPVTWTHGGSPSGDDNRLYRGLIGRSTTPGVKSQTNAYFPIPATEAGSGGYIVWDGWVRFGIQFQATTDSVSKESPAPWSEYSEREGGIECTARIYGVDANGNQVGASVDLDVIQFLKDAEKWNEDTILGYHNANDFAQQVNDFVPGSLITPSGDQGWVRFQHEGRIPTDPAIVNGRFEIEVKFPDWSDEGTGTALATALGVDSAFGRDAGLNIAPVKLTGTRGTVFGWQLGTDLTVLGWDVYGLGDPKSKPNNWSEVVNTEAEFSDIDNLPTTYGWNYVGTALPNADINFNDPDPFIIQGNYNGTSDEYRPSTYFSGSSFNPRRNISIEKVVADAATIPLGSDIRATFLYGQDTGTVYWASYFQLQIWAVDSVQGDVLIFDNQRGTLMTGPDAEYGLILDDGYNSAFQTPPIRVLDRAENGQALLNYQGIKVRLTNWNNPYNASRNNRLWWDGLNIELREDQATIGEAIWTQLSGIVGAGAVVALSGASTGLATRILTGVGALDTTLGTAIGSAAFVWSAAGAITAGLAALTYGVGVAFRRRKKIKPATRVASQAAQASGDGTVT